MPKKGSKQLGERERARLAVIPDLHAIYSTYFSEGVIDMIANQCNYDMDACIATLADMVHDSTSASHASASSSVPTVAASAGAHATAATSSAAHASASASDAANTNAESKPQSKKQQKKGILFLSPRPSSDLLVKQPPSVWQKPADRPPPKQPWTNHARRADTKPDEVTSSPDTALITPEAADIEAGYGSDANDEPLVLPGGYRHTGFESQPYFEMQPSLLEEVPPIVHLPTIPAGVVLDPHAPSAAKCRKIPDRDGVAASSPAHPAHSLHALYLQLQNADSVEPDRPKWGVSMFSAPPPSAAPVESAPEDLTPAQARAFQKRQHQQARQQKKDQATWMKRHEQEKKHVRDQTFTAGHTAVPEHQPSDAEIAAAYAFEAEQSDLSLAKLNLSPQDIPTMAPLTHQESQESFERVRARPQDLERLLIDLFHGEVDASVVRAILESILESTASDTNPSRERDVAQECCDTLLGIVAENESESQRRLEELNVEQQSLKAMAGHKSHSATTADFDDAHTPFVPSAHQLTDEELAWHLSVDPDFDPNNMAPLDANIGLTPQGAATGSAPVTRNKKGHIVVPRGTTNVWSARSAAASSVAPDLSSQWKLAALARAFPTVESEVIDASFRANDFHFDQTKAHLRAIYPNAKVVEEVRPAPVEQVWSQTTMHHSKVNTTSRIDAERGIVRGERLQVDWDSSAGNFGDALTDEVLEVTLGGVLDNRSAGSASAGSDLRAQATMHAAHRAAYFSAAMGAFTRGHGSLASDLARKGKAASRALASTSARAGIEVFLAHNVGQDCARAVDLHGLHVDEATRIAAFVLQRRARTATPNTEVSLITGVGHHSAGGVRGAKLGPAIAAFLKRAGYKFSNTREGEIRGQHTRCKSRRRACACLGWATVMHAPAHTPSSFAPPRPVFFR